MSDRELLMRAAAAAGVEIEVRGDIGESGVITGWNPLTDDGDAFRLAVKCDVAFIQFSDTIRATCCKGGTYTEFIEDDPLAAARRAIVRAAAALVPSAATSKGAA